MFPLSLFSLQRRRKALEVGCGDATKTYWYALLFDRYYAIDNNPQRIREAKENRPPLLQGRLHLANKTIKDVDKSNFDLILFANSFFFHDDLDETLQEVEKRIRKKGGVCIITQPLPKPQNLRDDRLNKASPMFDPEKWEMFQAKLVRASKFLKHNGFEHEVTPISDIFIRQWSL